MKKLFNKMMLILMVSCFSVTVGATASHPQYSENNYFQFAISQYHTTRQSGQVVNVYVKYAYKHDLPVRGYPDYRVLRTKVLQYMEPSEELPADVFWEVLASTIGKALMKDFPLEGVRVQLYVLDNNSPNANEPGDHGPTFTMGTAIPL